MSSERSVSGTISRRRFLQAVGVAVGAPIVAACAPTTSAPSGGASATAATAATAAPTATPRATSAVLTLVSPVDPTSFDPAQGTSIAEMHIIRNMFEGLTTLGRDAKAQPALATDWTVGADRLTWTFRLRDGVKFHDGEPLTAEAVKASFDRMLAKGATLRNIGHFTPLIDSVRAVDAKTIEMKLKRPFGLLPVLLTHPGASVWSPKALTAGGDLNRRPVGTGPFRFVRYEAAQRTVMARNDDYWGSAARPKELHVRSVKEDGTRVAMLETGEADIITIVPPPEAVRLGKDQRFKVVKADALESRGWKIDMRDPRWQDVRVRQALNYAINVPQIVGTVLQGFAKYTGPLPSSFAGALPQMYKHDPELAKKLLADAGKSGGFDADMSLDAGASALSKEVAIAVQAQLKAVGVRVRLVERDQEAGRQETRAPYDSKNFKGLMDVGRTAAYPDPHALLYQEYHSASWAPNVANYGFFKNPRVDQLLDLAVSESDQTKRLDNYREAQETIMKDAPVMWGPTVDFLYATRANISDFVVLPNQLIPFSEVLKS